MIDRILRMKTVIEATGDNRMGIYRKIAAGTFPRSISLGGRSVGWPESEVAAYNAARIRGASDDEIRELVASLHEKRKLAA